MHAIPNGAGTPAYIGRGPGSDKVGVFRTKRGKWEAEAWNPPGTRKKSQDAKAVAWLRARMIATVASISFSWSMGDFSGQIS
jgi:hypothetical protein